MSFLERQLEDPVRFRRLKTAFYVALAAIAILEFALPLLLHAEEGEFWFEKVPAWESIYGLISCVVIIVGSKLIGKLWLMKREDYYDR